MSVIPQLIRLTQYLWSPFPTRLLIALVRRFPKLAIGIPPGRQVAITHYLGDLNLSIDTTYPMERKTLSGLYEAATLAVIRRFVRPGAMCLDVGANVGLVTLALAKQVGSTGYVYAVEPGPPLFHRLEQNIARNPTLAPTVHLSNIGLSDSAGTLYWNEDMRNRGNGGLLGRTGSVVPVDTIDHFVAQQKITRLDFVKIDVEGMEEQVIRGGTTTWATLRPVLYYETFQAFRYRHGDDSFQAIAVLLAARNYSLFALRGGTLIPASVDHLSDNTLAIPNG